MNPIQYKGYYSVGSSPCRTNHHTLKSLRKHECNKMRSTIRNIWGEMLTTHTPKIHMTKTKKTFVRLFLTGLASVPPLLGLTAQAQSSITNGLVAYWNWTVESSCRFRQLKEIRIGAKSG